MKESGIGRENGVEAYESCQSKSQSITSFLHDILTGTGTPRFSNICTTDSQSKSTIVNIASPLTTRQTDDWFAEEENADRRYG